MNKEIVRNDENDEFYCYSYKIEKCKYCGKKGLQESPYCDLGCCKECQNQLGGPCSECEKKLGNHYRSLWKISRASKVKDIICPDCFDKFGDGS